MVPIIIIWNPSNPHFGDILKSFYDYALLLNVTFLEVEARMLGPF